MIIIPTGTNAPIYHWPVATVCTIAMCIIVSVASWLYPMELASALGDSAMGMEVVMSLFGYPDLFDLAFNCLALWIVGLVIEGKIGWWGFLPCYIFLGLVSLGVGMLLNGGMSIAYAHPVMFGLLGMAAVWAPLNDIDFTWYYFYFHRSVDFSAPIAMVAIVYVGGLSLLTWGIGSPWLWLLATLLGVAIASAMRFAKLVDCENADIFAVISGAYTPWAPAPEQDDLEFMAKRRDLEQTRTFEMLDTARAQLHAYLKQGNAFAALKLLDKLKEGGRQFDLKEEELVPIIRLLHEAGKFAESAPYLSKLIGLRGGGADPLRIKLAQICVVELKKPARALELLSKVDLQSQDPAHRKLIKKIADRAKEQQKDADLELDDDSW